MMVWNTHRAPPPKGIQAPAFCPAGLSQRSGLKASGSASPAHLHWSAWRYTYEKLHVNI